jgi:type IV pilus assembly protein PilA
MRTLATASRREDGFSLVEVLVVVIVIGILAAIALPAFIGQTGKARDATSKADARDMLSALQSCYAVEQDYTRCDSESELTHGGAEPIGLNYGNAGGQVEVKLATTDTFTIVGHSPSGNDFRIVLGTGGLPVTRTCTTAGHEGCPASSQW